MTTQTALGIAVGLVEAFVCWRGNQTPHLVSAFPDGVSLFSLVLLLSLAIPFALRTYPEEGRMASLRAGLTISASAGAVFGLAVLVLGVLRFTSLEPVRLAIGFLTAFGSSLACGLVVTLIWSLQRRLRAA